MNWIPKARYVRQKNLTASESPGTSVLKVKISAIFIFNNRTATDIALPVTEE
jgi:hypothetical protein